MKELNLYIIEKLRINNNIKLEDETLESKIIYLIGNLIQEELKIDKKEYNIKSEFYKDKIFNVYITFDSKYGDDELYNKFSKLKKSIKEEISEIGNTKIVTSWVDAKGVMMYFGFEFKI